MKVSLTIAMRTAIKSLLVLALLGCAHRRCNNCTYARGMVAHCALINCEDVPKSPDFQCDKVRFSRPTIGVK